MNVFAKTITVAVAGAVSLAGLGVVAATSPLGAVAATTAPDASGAAQDAPGLGDRLTAIKDALAGLVGDGSITQEQADEVATTLSESDALRDGRHGGGHFTAGRGLESAAEALGLTGQELRTALAEGRTLAQVAEAEGVATQTVIDALVTAATERIEEAVTDGRLTREQADERIADLPERMAAAVQDGFGRGGHGGRGGRGGPDGRSPAATDDAPTPTPGARTSGASRTV